MERLYINPRYQRFLTEHELATVDKLLGDNVQGDALERGDERNTYRLELAGKGFFLKQIYKNRGLQAFEPLLQLRQPHHYAWREMQHALNLKAAGIDVMEVAAAGERTQWGLGCCWRTNPMGPPGRERHPGPAGRRRRPGYPIYERRQ
jgi:hypothetical protein